LHWFQNFAFLGCPKENSMIVSLDPEFAEILSGLCDSEAYPESSYTGLGATFHYNFAFHPGL
jgi:hypothetical protein